MILIWTLDLTFKVTLMWWNVNSLAKDSFQHVRLIESHNFILITIWLLFVKQA